MTPTLIDLTGNRYGLLVVTGHAGKRGRYHDWNCVCDCGVTKTVTGDCLRSRECNSCGCNSRKACAQKLMKYGRKANGIREYRIWGSMISRCKYKHRKAAARYACRGITVCEEWKSYERFIADMGPAPSDKHSIDRINNDDGYHPGNCRWATPQEQGSNTSSNRRITHDGVTKTLMDWARSTGIERRTIAARIDHYGWSSDRALTTPVRSRGI